LENIYSDFIYKRTYSRWNWEKSRREKWEETTDRYYNFFEKRVPKKVISAFETSKEYLLTKNVMPSMRVLWTAGEALEKNNLAGYNCAYVMINYKKVFADIMFVLMSGTGIGFSIERQAINSLPEISTTLEHTEETIVFEDSREGWAEGFNLLINRLYEGYIPKTDLSKIRPEGSVLITFGGRASGPRPLKQLIDKSIEVFKNAKGRRLNSLECYDLICYIADCVIAGGTRRSAMSSLSNLSDQRMKNAKTGMFWEHNPQRMMANNSVAYTEKPDMNIFMEEWLSLAMSGTGERGVFNRESCKNIFKLNGNRRQYKEDMGCNPCFEIVLRPKELCNLSEVVIRSGDSLSTLIKKIKVATMFGMLQSTLTDFHFLDDDWTNNCKEENLLGVSLTGLYDHPILNNISDRSRDWLLTLKATALETATKWSKHLGVNMPTAITCIKPSGTVSQLVNSSSGMHPRYNKYYIRRVRVAKVDPISQFLIDKGIPYNPEVGFDINTTSTLVFDFPIKSPESSKIKSDVSAIEQLEYWKMLQLCYCEHKPSFTCYVKQDEWLEAGAWVYKNWNIASGISFLPDDGGVYHLPPYESIEESQYLEMINILPKSIDFEELTSYEKSDYTSGSKEYACVGNICEL
jgi:ribonucleoside-diphosphate reductase alpha chain